MENKDERIDLIVLGTILLFIFAFLQTC